MNAGLVNELANVSVLLGLATMLGMGASMLNQERREHLMWLALTLTVGLGFMLSLLILVGTAR